MAWLNIGIFILIVFLVSLYFLPYRKLKDKIFTKLFYDTHLISAFTYEFGRMKLHLQRNGDVWRITQPEMWLADVTKSRKFILRLSDIQIEDRIMKGNREDADYSLGKNGILTFYFGNKEVTLVLGGRSIKYDDFIYATKSGDKDILLINASFLAALPKDIDDFKNMLIFDGLYSQIKSIDFGVQEKIHNIMRTDGAWICRGQNVFDDKVQSVLTALMETEATGFIDSNMRLPAKPHAFITMKTTRSTVTRHFFMEESDPMSYLMPLDGKILKVRKSDIDRFLSF